ncbi:GIY-YIG nuclease family protein [Patescibacteria group bacterium]|nr:GIY-YIG nuclease family protein [Patescibacteria group bacterium]
MIFFVYILRTSENTLYTGQTNNLKRRLEEHRKKSARSARYMRKFDSFDLVYSEKFKSRGEAMVREVEIKKWPKSKKEAFLEKERQF